MAPSLLVGFLPGLTVTSYDHGPQGDATGIDPCTCDVASFHCSRAAVAFVLPTLQELVKRLAAREDFWPAILVDLTYDNANRGTLMHPPIRYGD